MADYRRPQIYAQLRRWDDLNDRWMDHFGRQDALVEIFVNRGRVVLSCRGQNYQQPFETPVDDAALVRSNDQMFQISKQGLRLELWFRSWRDGDDFQHWLGSFQLSCRDTRQQQSYNMSTGNFNQRSNFDQGPQYLNQGPNYNQGPGFNQGANFNQRPGFDRGPGFDQPPPRNQPYGGQMYDQSRYPSDDGGRDQRWNQNAAPGIQDVNQHYQNIPPNDQRGGASNYGRNQPQYDDRVFANNQPPGGGYYAGNMPPGGRPPQDYPPPPGRVQDTRPAPREAWGPDQRQVHPQSKMKFSENIDSATADLADAINKCELQTAYDIIKAMDIEKIDKSKRIFNVAINYYGDMDRQESVEEAPAEDKDEFKLKVAIERQCAPNENAIDIYIKAKEEDTIDNLEKLFEDKYKIPGEVQRWIIKQQLASDRSTCMLREFGVYKDGGPDQEVYLFVIQGMKERMKSDFFNKRQQQVEDTQRQQQQIAQEENYQKQLTFGQQVSSNRDQFVTLPQNDAQYQPGQQPLYDAQQHQPYDGQHQRRFQDHPQPSYQHTNMGGPGYQDQQHPPVVMQPQQPAFQSQQFQQQPRAPQPRNDFKDIPPQRNDFNIPQMEPRGHPIVEKHQVDDIFIPPNNRGPRGGVPVFPMAPTQKRPANEGPLFMAANPVGQAEKPNGWNCSKCTFLNEPYRPGCKMCSAGRPENYEVPVGHVASTDELKFINEVHQ